MSFCFIYLCFILIFMSEFEKKHLEQKNWPLHANILFDVIGDKSHSHKSAAINRKKPKKSLFRLIKCYLTLHKITHNAAFH